MDIVNGKMSMTLLPHQIEHFNRINKILEDSFFYLDTSPTGSGKTFTTAAVAIRNGMKLFVISPKMLSFGWRKCAELTNIDIIDVVSYESFRSTKHSQPKKYLTRKDYTVKLKSDQDPKALETTEYEFTDFSVKDDLRNVWKKNVLFVFDEIHKAVSNTVTMKAIATVVQMGVSMGGGSRIAFLSATLYDQEKMALIFFKLIGLYQTEIEQPKSKKYLSSVIEYANKIDPIKTPKLIGFTAVGTAYNLFINVVKPSIHSEMPPPSFAYPFDYKKVFYRLDNIVIFDYIQKLAETLAFKKNPFDGNDVQAIVDLPQKDSYILRIISLLNEINKMKIPILKRIVTYQLKVEPACKVVVFADLIEILKAVGDHLHSEGFVPLYLTENEDINSNVNKFNSPNSDYRVILSTTTRGVGINLHDTNGEFPRWTYLLPNFQTRSLHQAAGRCYRVGVQSIARLRMVFVQTPDGNPSEFSILNNIKRKTEVLKSLNFAENLGESRILYPGDYPEHIETEKEYIATLN